VSYLLDTNVLSELVRPQPGPAVLDWFEDVPNDSLYISVQTGFRHRQPACRDRTAS